MYLHSVCTISLTNEAMGVCVPNNAVPHHVQMLSCEVDSEAHAQVFQIHMNRRIVEMFYH